MAEPPPLAWRWRGRIPYLQALAEQRARRDAILAGQAPEEIWLLEHEAVITTGRRGADGVAPDAILAARGIHRVATERGGLATFHGPGQLVAYLLVDAGGRGFGVRDFVRAIEDALIGWLADRGVAAGRRGGLPGVWVGTNKIAALGLHFKRGVTLHGLAVNLDPDLSAFDLFVPCGVRDGGVTSLARERGSAPDSQAASAVLGPILAEALRAPAGRDPASP